MTRTTPPPTEAVPTGAASCMKEDVVIPAKTSDLVNALLAGGWSFVVNHGKDTGDHPYINIEARRDHGHVYVTWHTRATGTYRLFTCMVNKRDMTLTRAMSAIKEAAA